MMPAEAKGLSIIITALALQTAAIHRFPGDSVSIHFLLMIVSIGLMLFALRYQKLGAEERKQRPIGPPTSIEKQRTFWLISLLLFVCSINGPFMVALLFHSRSMLLVWGLPALILCALVAVIWYSTFKSERRSP